MVKSICIDDQNRPKEIPVSKWVEKGKNYTIIYVYWHPNQGVQGVDLAEIDLDGCEPYATFKINRFAIPKSEVEKFIDLCKLCTEMSNVNINELVQELTVEEV